MSRARDNGDPMSALDRLRGLLISGKLKAWSVDQHMNLSECPPDMWKDRRNNHLLTEPDETRIETEVRNLRIVFLTSDLDRVLPTLLQQIERESASALSTPITRRETSGNDLAALQSAPNDAASTIDASYEESQDGALIPANSKAIREAIMAVYACALEQGAAIPNNREMCKFVNIILERKFSIARPAMVEKLAREVRAKERGGRYEQLFCGSGETAARKNLQRSNKLNV